MPALLVTYDLKSSEQDYSTFQSMLHSYPWINISESAVVLATDTSANEFFEGIWPYIDQHDQVLVFAVTADWSGTGSEEVKKWLKERL